MSLPNAPLETIIRNSGAERVSEDAVAELRSAVQEAEDELAQDALNLVNHAHRNTVKKEDVEMATQ